MTSAALCDPPACLTCEAANGGRERACERGSVRVAQSSASSAGGDAAFGSNRAHLLTDAEALCAYLRRHLATRAFDEPLASTPARARVAGVLAPLYARDGQPYLLFTQRTDTLSSHRGEISFPGGSRDLTDASLDVTALRETHEELGIAPERVDVLGQLPRVFAAVSNFIVTPYVGWLGEGLPSLTPNPREVALVIEAPVAALADPSIFHEEQWTRNGLTHTVYFYDLGPHRIWGLTGRILHQLLALLPAPTR